jgi:2-hydroxychromene-2-carboxylate isomerase
VDDGTSFPAQTARPPARAPVPVPSNFVEAIVTAPELEFWFEFGSTYSYLSAVRVEDEAAAAGVRVSWEPFLLGPIFREQGWNDSPFNVHPGKGRYMRRDVERLCAGYGIPFRKPSRFPRNALLAARVACLAVAASEHWLPDFARAVFRANFAEDREIEDPAEIRAILDGLGRPGAELVERAGSPEAKQLLRDRTRRAGELGIFGAPSFVVGGELFWGNDRMRDALAWTDSRANGDADRGPNRHGCGGRQAP